MTGCLFTVDSHEKSTSNQWSDADGTEIWRYENVKQSESEVGLFLIFHVEIEKEDSEMLAIEFRDGVVTDYWTESHRH